MNKKRHCLTCENKGCISLCRFAKNPDPRPVVATKLTQISR
jgi:hypothetical protein